MDKNQTTIKETEQLFHEHKHTLIKRAYWVARMYSRMYMVDELQDEAIYGFTRIYNIWVEGGRKGKFNTLLYRATTNSLINFLRRYDHAMASPSEAETFGPEPSKFSLSVDIHELRRASISSSTRTRPDKQLSFKETLQSLSKEATRIVEILLGTPDEVLNVLGTETQRTLRRIIREKLVSEGFKRDATYKAFSELKTVVRNF